MCFFTIGEEVGSWRVVYYIFFSYPWYFLFFLSGKIRNCTGSAISDVFPLGKDNFTLALH